MAMLKDAESRRIWRLLIWYDKYDHGWCASWVTHWKSSRCLAGPMWSKMVSESMSVSYCCEIHGKVQYISIIIGLPKHQSPVLAPIFTGNLASLSDIRKIITKKYMYFFLIPGKLLLEEILKELSTPTGEPDFWNINSIMGEAFSNERYLHGHGFRCRSTICWLWRSFSMAFCNSQGQPWMTGWPGDFWVKQNS